MKMLLPSLAVLLLLIGSLSQAASLNVPLEAQRYLQGCITSIAVAEVREPSLADTLTGPLSCDSPAFDMAQSYYGESSSPAVAGSRVNLGAGKLGDFRVTVTDISGKVWTGTESNRPKVKPRPPSPQWLAQAQAAAYQVAAQNTARSCVTAIEIYKVNNLERLQPDWNGKGCIEAGLVAGGSRAAIEKSLITLHPEMQEGYQVTIWPRLWAVRQ